MPTIVHFRYRNYNHSYNSTVACSLSNRITELAFAVGPGAVVGYRMSSEAMAVVVGVVCGVAASIPMSLLILILTRRMDRQQYEEHYEPPFDKLRTPRREYPLIVVVSPGGIQQLPPLPSPLSHPTRFPATREFRVIGEDQWQHAASLRYGVGGRTEAEEPGCSGAEEQGRVYLCTPAPQHRCSEWGRLGRPRRIAS